MYSPKVKQCGKATMKFIGFKQLNVPHRTAHLSVITYVKLKIIFLALFVKLTAFDGATFDMVTMIPCLGLNPTFINIVILPSFNLHHQTRLNLIPMLHYTGFQVEMTFERLILPASAEAQGFYRSIASCRFKIG
ncbi:hypothetical protein IW261DRAFT_1426086 [Armillaria novae-zelandiae]|uniref:Uncharacterized protein n=1 Tax=Armillaria novae-zelandiae TaxID=153914 RepID=A0AA39NNG7_9AGAR|nr:hypothetical protein IW261DRAFT_1426086 [Armillaria novae-zelandiae]